MRFTSNNPFATTSFYRMSMIRDAVAIVTNYRILPKEYRLNQYLLTNYKKDLKMIAIDLIKHCKIYHDLDKTATVIFRNEQDKEHEHRPQGVYNEVHDQGGAECDELLRSL